MKWDEAIKHFKIEKVYHDCSLDKATFLPKGIIQIGKDWIASKNRQSLYLTGDTGSGKTYFTLCLLRAIIESGNMWQIYIRSDDLDTDLLRAIEEKQEKYFLEKYQEVPYLFIDDLGVERVNERILKQYFAIINARTGNLLPTIITSNIPLDQIKDTFGDRISSRLSVSMEVVFPKHDLRKALFHA